MDFLLIFEKVVIFIIFIACMMLLAAYLKRYKHSGIVIGVSKDAKLKLEETLIIDASNKVVKLSHEDDVYIVHLGNNAVLIDKIARK